MDRQVLVFFVVAFVILFAIALAFALALSRAIDDRIALRDEIRTLKRTIKAHDMAVKTIAGSARGVAYVIDRDTSSAQQKEAADILKRNGLLVIDGDQLAAMIVSDALNVVDIKGVMG